MLWNEGHDNSSLLSTIPICPLERFIFFVSHQNESLLQKCACAYCIAGFSVLQGLRTQAEAQESVRTLRRTQARNTKYFDC